MNDLKKRNLLIAWKNVISAHSVIIQVDGLCIGAFDDVDTTVKALRVAVARECVNVRSTTCYQLKMNN